MLVPYHPDLLYGFTSVGISGSHCDRDKRGWELRVLERDMRPVSERITACPIWVGDLREVWAVEVAVEGTVVCHEGVRGMVRRGAA